MQVGTSWEVHWSRLPDLSVNAQDGGRALVTARIKVSSFSLQNTTFLLAGNLLLLLCAYPPRCSYISTNSRALSWQLEKRRTTVRINHEHLFSSSTLPFWRFALVPFHLMLRSTRNFLINTHPTLSRKCLRHLLQMRATSATALETLSVCYQPFQLSFNITLVWFKYSTLLPELMMSIVSNPLHLETVLSPRWPVVSPTSSFVSFANILFTSQTS